MNDERDGRGGRSMRRGILRTVLTVLASTGALIPSLPSQASTDAAGWAGSRAPWTASAQPAVTTAGVSCAVHRQGFDRHTACGQGSGTFTIKERRTRKTLGTMKVSIVQKTVLAARDGRTWTHTLTLRPTAMSGLATAATAKIAFDCGHGPTACTASRQPARKLTLRQATTFTFTLTSPGTRTLTHHERPIITLFTTAPPTTGNLPRMETVRCDSVRGISTRVGGCVHPRATPVFTLHRNDPRISEAATHVRDAQLHLRGHPGLRGQGQPLHRTTDKELITKNRNRACPSSLRRPPGKSCDEYPFASTQEGGASGVFSRRMIDEDHNSTAGGSDYLLKAYKSNRILNGDAFWVHVT